MIVDSYKVLDRQGYVIIHSYSININHYILIKVDRFCLLLRPKSGVWRLHTIRILGLKPTLLWIVWSLELTCGKSGSYKNTTVKRKELTLFLTFFSPAMTENVAK